MKTTTAALQLLLRIKDIRGELRLTSADFKTCRGTAELFRAFFVLVNDGYLSGRRRKLCGSITLSWQAMGTGRVY
ncbi:hypothetical protein ACJJI3_03250 [Microbulbifer sp. ZKSA004]|uniref:hypothetical protein n=1 Tax=Microbulbifer sp. ZKSA004 TaxID=3243389 RepID=UPI004039C23F